MKPLLTSLLCAGALTLNAQPSGALPGLYCAPFYHLQNPQPSSKILGGQWIIEQGGTRYWFYDSFGNDTSARTPLLRKHLAICREGAITDETSTGGHPPLAGHLPLFRVRSTQVKAETSVTSCRCRTNIGTLLSQNPY
jgi:hypothetical protein